jgi:hypothetical protein
MSAAPPNPTPPSHLTPSHPVTASNDEIIIVSHSNLFYWWPVWAVGFLLFLLTYVDGYRMAIVPEGTKAIPNVQIDGKEYDVYALPPLKAKEHREIKDPSLHATGHKSYAVLWTTVLILVIVITNVPLRGMWSFVVILVVIFLAIIFHAWELWEPILEKLSLLDIRINAGGYLFVSSLLFVVWLVTMLFFDRQVYMVFTPGQFKVQTEIGGGAQVYDAVGMTLQKQRSDLFRHWILGLGSGDLIVKTSGAQAHQFEMDNVLFITKKVQQIEEMLKKKSVIESK